MIISRRKEILKRVLCFFFASLFTILAPASTYALNPSLFKEYSQADIYFYDPSAGAYLNFCNSGGDCYITGNTDEEKLWSALRHVGFTPEQTAALMGNIANEGGNLLTRQEDAYNIARNRGCLTNEGNVYTIHTDVVQGDHHSSCMEEIYSGYYSGRGVDGIGLGLIQWTDYDRREGFLKKMEEAGLLKYFEGDAYKKYGSPLYDGAPETNEKLRELIITETGSDADYWALWCATVRYLWAEMHTSLYDGFFEQNTLEDYAGFVSARYEVCDGCSPGGSQYSARMNNAIRIYDKYKNGDFDAVEKGTAIPNTTEVDKDETKPDTEENEGDENLEEDNEEEINKEEQPKKDEPSKVTASTESCSTIPTGGVRTVEEALIFAQQYIIDTNKTYGKSFPDLPARAEFNVAISDAMGEDGVQDPCWGAYDCGECTAISGWFVNMMTGYSLDSTGDGRQTTNELLLNNSDLTVSDQPSVFSIFSEPSSAYGHTGVVIGQLDSGEFITLENNVWRDYKMYIMTRSDFIEGASFVNVNEKLNLGHLGEQ